MTLHLSTSSESYQQHPADWWLGLDSTHHASCIGHQTYLNIAHIIWLNQADRAKDWRLGLIGICTFGNNCTELFVARLTFPSIIQNGVHILNIAKIKAVQTLHLNNNTIMILVPNPVHSYAEFDLSFRDAINLGVQLIIWCSYWTSLEDIRDTSGQCGCQNIGDEYRRLLEWIECWDSWNLVLLDFP